MIIYVYVRVVTYMDIIYMEHHCEQNWCKILNPVKGLDVYLLNSYYFLSLLIKWAIYHICFVMKSFKFYG